MKKQIALVAAALAALALAAPALADSNLTPPPAAKPTATSLSAAVKVTGVTGSATRSQSLLNLRISVACNYGLITAAAPYDPAAGDQWMYWYPTWEASATLAGYGSFARIAVGPQIAQRAGQHSYWIQRTDGGWNGPYANVTTSFKPTVGGYPMVYRLVDFLRWTPNGVSTGWSSGPRATGSYTGPAAISGDSCIYF
jgi:hypothetical protein